jgi:ribosomal protein S27AE
MNIYRYSKSFPDENACIEHFKAQRDQNGVVCPKCGGKEHSRLKGKLRYECKQCHYRQWLRSGSVMEHSKLPLQYRYMAMHLLTSTKKSFSEAEHQRQPGHKRYQPIWELLNKLRDVMGKRDDKYRHGGQIELDNAFIPSLIPDGEKDRPLKRGVGSQKQSKAVVMTESAVVENTRQGMKARRVNHLKMVVMTICRQKPLPKLLNYLNEFCYKFNRRYFREHLFDRLVLVAATYQTDFRSKIYNRSLCG